MQTCSQCLMLQDFYCILPILSLYFRSRDLDLMREPDIVNLDADEEWLCPECTAPYSKDAIESELVA